ncbi:Rv2175c family DNA-binding protein [Corynebacterium endometrii]|uniref:Rv2175c family DNA-binding protein n=1 Tax=Corynebacterium endometrii TaxID=2488819 RepID=UPI003CCC5F2D
MSVTNPSNPDLNLEQLLANETLLTMPEVADKLGIVVTRAHDLLTERKIIAWRKDGVRYVPEAFFNEKNAVSKFVSGVITVLSDGGYSDDEILHHLFTEDESLPGRPIDALHGHLAREVIRRAQAMAF